MEAKLRDAIKSKRPLKVLTICGVGQGSCFILKMFVEEALNELGIEAEVEAGGLSIVTAAHPDVILAGLDFASEVSGLAPVVIPIKDFTSVNEIKEKFMKYVFG